MPPLSYPRLKPGVESRTRGAEILFTLPYFAIALPLEPARTITRYFDGRHELAEITQGTGMSYENVVELQSVLTQNGLVENLRIPLSHIFNGPHADPSAVLTQMKLQSELDLITHRPDSNDGGVKELSLRGAFTILISGENRLARNLLATLQSMGFNNTRIITRAHLSAHIGPDDVCGLATRMSDIGKKRNEFAQEIMRNSQFIPTDQVAKADPDLIISTIPIEWDYVQRWMSEGTTHLHINPLIGQHCEIGPLVIPGLTPCLRCVALTKKSTDLSLLHESMRTELPTQVIATLVGMVATLVGQYAATGDSPLTAASHWVNLLSPFEKSEKRYWEFNASCGCSN